jgi:hypothetical protein
MWSNHEKPCPSCFKYDTTNYIKLNTGTKLITVEYEKELLEKIVELERKLGKALVALKSAEGYMFLACQPSRGDLFSEFDEKNMEVIKEIEGVNNDKPR